MIINVHLAREGRVHFLIFFSIINLAVSTICITFVV